MTFTATEVILIIGAITTCVTQIIGTWRTGTKQDKVIKAVIGTAAEPGLVPTVKEIHTLTNSTMTEIRAELAATRSALDLARNSIKSMQTTIDDLKSERDKHLTTEPLIKV